MFKHSILVKFKDLNLPSVLREGQVPQCGKLAITYFYPEKTDIEAKGEFVDVPNV